MAQLLKAALIHIDINHHGDIEDAILQVCCKLVFFLAARLFRYLELRTSCACRHLLAPGPFPKRRARSYYYHVQSFSV